MANRRLSLRKIREALRLRFELKLTFDQIADSLKVSSTSARNYIKRAQDIGLSWPLSLTDTELESKLFVQGQGRPRLKYPDPDWNWVHGELKRKGVTKQLIWHEHNEKQEGSLSYSQFCHRYRRWAKLNQISMRQVHKAGEKLFVDYAGHTIPIFDRYSGKHFEAQIFVAALGASHYAYCEASASQKLEHWIGAHVRCFDFLGGVPEIVVCDNLKSGVTKACYYDPDINPTYLHLSEHYNCAIIPARKYHPKDKAIAENSVLIVERWVLARLRNFKFFSLAELNNKLQELMDQYNQRPMQKLQESRLELFNKIDRLALKPLPNTSYEFTYFIKAKVNIDYHVEIEKHYYSVPYQLRGERIEARICQNTVEIFLKNKRIASHVRNNLKFKHTTKLEHMPKSHQKYLEWSPTRLISWANNYGPHTAALVEKILSSRTHPEQGYRAALGVLRLGKKYSSQRLENACKRAMFFRLTRYQNIKSILEKGLDNQELPAQVNNNTSISHDNIRGRDYFS